MTLSTAPAVDANLDLVLERVIDVPRHLVWQAWTRPEYMMKWFTPAPWQTVECTLDLRPGGAFYTRMRGPQGEDFPNTGCILEVVEKERLVWTGGLQPAFRPRPATVNEHDFAMTAVIALESVGAGTKYTAHVMHGDVASRERHEAMGFHTGWGIALDQLVAFVKTLS